MRISSIFRTADRKRKLFQRTLTSSAPVSTDRMDDICREMEVVLRSSAFRDWHHQPAGGQLLCFNKLCLNMSYINFTTLLKSFKFVYKKFCEAWHSFNQIMSLLYRSLIKSLFLLKLDKKNELAKFRIVSLALFLQR